MRLRALHQVRFMVREPNALQNFASDFRLANAEFSDARLIIRTITEDEGDRSFFARNLAEVHRRARAKILGLNAAALLGLQAEIS